MNIGTLTVVLGADLTGLDKLTTGLNTISQRFRTFGYLASTALTLPLVMAGKASFQMAKDFEFSMQKIVGLAGVAQDEVNKWREEVLKMGPQLAQTPQALAESLYFIASSGIKGAEALDVLALSAKAASSGMGETRAIADFLTSALNAYKGTGLTAAYATDVLTKAVIVGKAEAAGFASAMGSVIPIAALLNVSLDQVAGAMAAITLSGSTAAQAATYLKGMFNNLMKGSETGKGAQALNSIKTSYAELRTILKEGGIIPMLEKVRAGMVQYGDTLVAKVFPNIRAMTAVLSIAGKNFEYNSKIMKEVTNSTGALGAAWLAVSNTIKVRFDKAISQANVSMVVLGKSIAETVLPILESLVKSLSKVVKWFNSLTEEQKRHRIEFLMWIAVLGPATLLISVFGYAMSGLIAIVTGVIGAIQAFTLCLAVNPILAAAVAILAVGNALMILALRSKDAADKQTALNSLMNDMYRMRTEGSTGSKSVEDRMSMLSKLDEGQLKQLQNDINTRIQLEKDLNIKLLAAKKEGIQDDQWILDQKKKIAESYLTISTLESMRPNIGTNIKIEFGITEVKKVIGETQKAINEYTTGLKDNLDYQIESMPRIIGLWEGYGKNVGKAINDITDPIQKQIALQQKQVEEADEIKKVFEDYAEGLLYISRMTDIMGGSFDIASAKTDLYKKTVEDLANTSIPILDKRLKAMVSTLQTLNHQEFFKKMEETLKKEAGPGDASYHPDYTKLFAASKGEGELSFMKKFQSELDLIALKTVTLGNRFDTGRAQLTYFKQILEKMWDAGSRPGQDKMLDNLIKQTKQLTIQQEIVDGLKESFTNFFTSIISGTESVGNAFKKMGQQIIQIFARMMAEMIATGIMKFIMNLIVPGSGLFIVGGLGIGEGVKGAKGGTVPSGFSNDTYPALLSSGEKILPAGFNGSMMLELEPVSLSLKEYDLQGWIRKSGARKKLY